MSDYDDTARHVVIATGSAPGTILATGHVPMLSMPDRVVAVIVDAAGSSAK